MSKPIQSKHWTLYNESCYGLPHLKSCSIDAIVTDPPYGISFQSHDWDRALPDPAIWRDSLRVLKPGGFGLVFSSVRLLHRLMSNLEDTGFLIKDVLFWIHLNGMPKTRDIGLEIDKQLGAESRVIGKYRYVQGYKRGGSSTYTLPQQKMRKEPVSQLGAKYKGSGLGLKPAYEPIVLVQKPIEEGLTIAENVIQYGTGALNLEDTRIPYAPGEAPVGHNPHPRGRVAPNVMRSESVGDEYDKFFVVPKVRQGKDSYNEHPTIKPVHLMQHLVKLVSFQDQTVLDPFMGSGSTGVACLDLDRHFVGYERESEYVNIAEKRLNARGGRGHSQKAPLNQNPQQSELFGSSARGLRDAA